MLSCNKYPSALRDLAPGGVLFYFILFWFVCLVGLAGALEKKEQWGEDAHGTLSFPSDCSCSHLGNGPGPLHDSQAWERTRLLLMGKWWLVITQQTSQKNKAWGTPVHILNTSLMQALPLGEPAEISINQHTAHCESSPSLQLQMKNVTTAWLWRWLMLLKCVFRLFEVFFPWY